MVPNVHINVQLFLVRRYNAFSYILKSVDNAKNPTYATPFLCRQTTTGVVMST